MTYTDNKLWQDIQSQSENLYHVIDNLLGPERERLQAAARFLQNERPITMIGIGSAVYLCSPAEVYLGQHGRIANTAFASDAFYNLLPALHHSNVVINSRSGETTEVVRLGQALAEQGIPFVTITNEPDSTLARLSIHILWSNSRKDELVSINIVTSMMLTTLVLAAAIVGELPALTPALLRLPDQMADVVTRASDQAEQIADTFAGVRPIYLLYRSTLKGAALNGRLTLEEVARTPGVVMEAGDFRQGPNEVIDERFGAVVFMPYGKQGNLNRSLAADILRSGGRVMLVGSDNNPLPGALHFSIPELPDTLSPVIAVVPVQVLAYKLAQRQGYAPGEVRYISKVILSEEGIPNQQMGQTSAG
jgi:glucosamine--fructose-6-phosphate aminotransferase (isomerizing)